MNPVDRALLRLLLATTEFLHLLRRVDVVRIGVRLARSPGQSRRSIERPRKTEEERADLTHRAEGRQARWPRNASRRSPYSTDKSMRHAAVSASVPRSRSHVRMSAPPQSAKMAGRPVRREQLHSTEYQAVSTVGQDAVAGRGLRLWPRCFAGIPGPGYVSSGSHSVNSDRSRGSASMVEKVGRGTRVPAGEDGRGRLGTGRMS